MIGYKLLLPRHVKQMNREYKEIIPSGFPILSTQILDEGLREKNKENTFKLKRENKVGSSH